MKNKKLLKMRKAAIMVLLAAVLISACGKGASNAGQADNTSQESSGGDNSDADAADDGSTDSADGTSGAGVAAADEITATHYVDIVIENYGTITAALDGNTAPETVKNFAALAEDGFYNGLTFHRIMAGFMMQGGDPNGDGTGGAENTIVGEFAENGIENPLSHVRGAISMARSNEYDSASSQFFIVHQDSTFLDGQYAVFGYVTEGMDVVDQICEAAEPVDDNGTIPSDAQPVITSITIRSA